MGQNEEKKWLLPKHISEVVSEVVSSCLSYVP